MRRRSLIAVISSLLLTGCDGTLLPNFDGGLLNPEFHHLRAGDVMNGVRCAMVAFMLEREEELLKQRERAIVNDAIGREYLRQFRRFEDNFQPYAIGAVSEAPCQNRGQHRDGKGICVPNKCKAGSIGHAIWDYGAKGNLDPEPRGCVPVPEYSRFALDPNQSATMTFTLNGTNSGFINYARIDATKLDGLYPKWIVPGGGPNSNPFPQMMPTVKGTTTFEMAVTMPQSIYSAPAKVPVFPVITYSYSAKFKEFRADLARSAKLVEQAISITPDLIEPSFRTFAQEKLNFLDSKIEGAKGDKTPTTEALEKWRNVAVSPQISAQQARDALQPLTDDLKQINELKLQIAAIERASSMGGDPDVVDDKLRNLQVIMDAVKDDRVREGLRKKAPTTADVIAREGVKAYPVPITTETFTPQALSARLAENKAKLPGVAKKRAYAIDRAEESADEPPDEVFKERCLADRFGFRIGSHTHIDYLALKRMLQNVVAEQNDRLHAEGPAMTLDSLTLSTSFQVTLEVQAGTNHIFRIVPLLTPPNTELKGDHTHTLKLVLKGMKKKGDPHYSKKLVASCQQRLQDNKAALDRKKCDTVEGILLEAIAEAVESGTGN